jgi:predicted alpha/beta hydrolase family esterase
VRLQNAGHINIDSGFGAWPLGLALLQSLVETPATSSHSLELQTV